jgi:MYXO-CTERM domain-containing protein
VTPGFAVRPHGSDLIFNIQNADGEDIAFEEDELGQILLPLDLAAGTYFLFEQWSDSPGVEVEVLEQPPEFWVVPDDTVQLSDVAWEQEWVSEWLTASCMELQRRRHTIETLSFQVPASQQNGWAARIHDSSTEMVFWVGLDEQAKTVDFRQDLERYGDLERGDRCLQIGLYNPQGTLQQESEVVCEAREELVGCSSTQSSPALLGGLLGVLGLLGLRRRR